MIRVSSKLPVRTAARPVQDRGARESSIARSLYRDSPSVLDSFAGLAERAAPSVAAVYSGDRQVAWATVVATDGWLLTKSSELGEVLAYLRAALAVYGLHKAKTRVKY